MAAYRWKDILWLMQAPGPEVLGWLDWPSGLLFVNANVADPQKFLVSAGVDDPPRRALLQTISHETLHFLQIATTGYMYRWVCEHYRLTVESWTPLRPSLDVFIQSPGANTLRAVQSQVDPGHRTALQEHLSVLDRRGANGISVRHLLEAHAQMAELTVHYEGQDQATFLELLGEHAAGAEYRHAYDLVRCRLGEHTAYRYFMLVASVSLCADDPPTAFDELLEALARKREPDLRKPLETDWVLAAASESVPGLIGSSAQVMEGDDVARHPVYTPAVKAINSACDRGLKIADYFADPKSGLELIAAESMRPIVFRPNASHQFAIIVPEGMKKSEVESLLLFAVLTPTMALGGADTDQQSSEGSAAWAWLMDLHSHITELGLNAEQVGSCEIEAMTALDPCQQSAVDRRRLSVLWNRCVLSLDIDEPGPLWFRNDVRQFVRALAEAQPAFPMYLNHAAEFGMFMFWFGSLADAEAFHGNSLDIQHSSVTDRVVAAAQAIHDLASGLNLDVTPVLQNLLVSYTHEQAKDLLAQLVGRNATR